jgi:asparagine synthase (glutamine-hydrolysing)
MCGLSGIIKKSGISSDLSNFITSTKLLAHRGPDSQRFALANSQRETLKIYEKYSDVKIESDQTDVAMGFNRLAIIDTSENGNQPMRSSCLRYLMLFNGEVYNAPELKSKYLQMTKFNGSSDSEILIELFSKFDLNIIPELNGMFAIGLWDFKTKTLHLIRDRCGIKPLYYFKNQDFVAFASEIKSIFAFSKVPRKINSQAVEDYLTFQFIPAPKTMFKDIWTVEPGTVESFQLSEPNRPKISRFWQWQKLRDTHKSIDSAAEDLRARLDDAIKIQTRSDVNVGSFLSSGIDTGSITSLANDHIKPLHTFTCGFETSESSDFESFFDERGHARELADLLKTLHHEIVLDHTELPKMLDSVMHYLECPSVGISYQILKMAEEVQRHCKVVLSGTGGDELFGGYTWRYKNIIQRGLPVLDSIYTEWNRLLSTSERANLYTVSFKSDLQTFSSRITFDLIMNGVDSEDPIDQCLFFEFQGFLRGLLLVDDKLNMAHSVEARVPFLDNHVIELSQTIPSHMKNDLKQSKKVLRNALSGILSEDVLRRRKQGFTPPEESWMNKFHRNWIIEELNSRAFVDLEIFDPKSVNSILDEQFCGKRNHRFLIWGLLCISSMSKQFLN